MSAQRLTMPSATAAPRPSAHGRRQIRAGRYRIDSWILRNACGTS
jgi:hypothetical protein